MLGNPDNPNAEAAGADTARQANLLDRKAAAWITLVMMVLLTIGLWHHSKTDLARNAQDRFLVLAEGARERVIDRMTDYEQVLRGGVALFATSDAVTRGDWHRYVDGMELDRYLPGIQGVGFALMLPRESVAAHERAIRAEGFPSYRVHPPGDRDMFSSILYLEPFTGRNLRAFGFDMYSDPVRREAMDRARDTGMPALSGKVRLVQESGAAVQPGFLLYLPVYHEGMPLDSVADRRRALRGFVYSPFRAGDLMRELFEDEEKDVDIELFDGSPRPENLLFSSEAVPRVARFVTDMELDIAGHVWVARFRSSPSFEALRASAQPMIILFGGLALDLLFFSVLYMNARHRRRMREAAAALARSRDNFKALVENIPGSVFRSRIDTREVAHISCGIEALTGEPPERFLGGEVSLERLIHPDDQARVAKVIDEAIADGEAYRIEYRLSTPSGRSRWVSERGRVIFDAHGRPEWLDGVILDIDDRKKAEIAIRDMAFNDPLTGLPNRRLLLDRLEHQLAISSRTGRPGALLFLDLDKFKPVNDSLGHAIGDLLLMEVAHRLRSHIRESDTVARLGGDEFVVMLDDLGEPGDDAVAWALDVGNKILAELRQPYHLDDHVIESGASIGVTLFRGHHASAEELLRRADQAMYRAKAAGRNRIEVC